MGGSTVCSGNSSCILCSTLLLQFLFQDLLDRGTCHHSWRGRLDVSLVCNELLLHLIHPTIEQAELVLELVVDVEGGSGHTCRYGGVDVGNNSLIELLHGRGSNDLEIGMEGCVFSHEWRW